MARRWLKHISFGSLIAITAALVAATILEKAKGTPFALEHIYRSPLFVTLWFVLAATALTYIIIKKERRTLFMLHASLAVILLGGLLSLTTARRGEVTLAKDAPPASMFTTAKGELIKVPFRMSLGKTDILYDKAGKPDDYIAEITIDGNESVTASMNKPLKKEGYTFCIKSRSTDAVSLLASHDPLGVPVTYAGYMLFTISFIMLFTEKKSGFNSILQQLKKGGKDEEEKKRAHTGIWRWIPFGILTAFIGLRWYKAGMFPITNGAESLFALAWAICAVVLNKRVAHLSKPLLATACIITVIATSNLDWENNIQPVLRTPLLGIHVSVIITAYALLGCTAINAIIALCGRNMERARRQALIGRLLLYPATMLLACGIFIGAVWANISWGRYWGWDPKEVWALITLLLCSLTFHTKSMPQLANLRKFHIFCLFLFTAMLFTYLGVNYFLGGMHAYM